MILRGPANVLFAATVAERLGYRLAGEPTVAKHELLLLRLDVTDQGWLGRPGPADGAFKPPLAAPLVDDIHRHRPAGLIEALVVAVDFAD
jgi:hypothetical protein